MYPSKEEAKCVLLGMSATQLYPMHCEGKRVVHTTNTRVPCYLGAGI